jgi:predicted Zn-dependent protease
MVILSPGELPASPEAAAAFERVAQPESSKLVFDAAVKKWPDEPIALVGRGTASYRAKDIRAAADDYAAALKIDPAQHGARNNLAMTLLELGCPKEAGAEIGKIDMTRVEGPLREAVRDTKAQIEAQRNAGQREPVCSYQRS